MRYLIALVLLCGCGQSYEGALAVYTQEAAELDRLKAEREAVLKNNSERMEPHYESAAREAGGYATAEQVHERLMRKTKSDPLVKPVWDSCQAAFDDVQRKIVAQEQVVHEAERLKNLLRQ